MVLVSTQCGIINTLYADVPKCYDSVTTEGRSMQLHGHGLLKLLSIMEFSSNLSNAPEDLLVENLVLVLFTISAPIPLTGDIFQVACVAP